MKKIINGKVYNTSTATKRASYNNGLYGEFGYLSETLYLKKTGEFFLHGEGGPMTKYATTVGQNNWSGGEAIIPLSYQAAREWGEEHLSGDEYESIFGEVVEDEGRTTVTWSLDAGLAARLRREAQEAEMTVGALVEKKLG